ncbi:MAG: hypothetical protein K0U37_03215 [Gammaproteobacteria bacterium]|nr:hypothetical protein [Gammaproteobacteria bacterium]
MALILKQLEIQKVISQGKNWEEADFSRLAENAWLWRVQYRAHCSHLIAHLNQTKPNTEKTKEIANATLFMAELLESLHERLNEAPAKAKFTQDKVVLKKLLKKPEDAPIKEIFNMPGLVQNVTFHSDTTRLLIGNLRRICLGLLSFPETFGHDLTWANQFASFLGPILTFAGFLVYLPRTIVNGFMLSKRLSEKQEISFKSRLQAHCDIDDRLFNLVNDFPSVLAGTIAVFILTSATAWLAAYITVAVKLCEVIFAAARSHYDVSRLYAMRAEYSQHKKLNNTDLAYLKHLDASIAHTKGVRNTNTTMHALLLLCLASFTPPIMMLHPAIPIFAAIFAISLVCLRIPDFRNLWITEPPPKDNLETLSGPRFFQSVTEAPPSSHEGHDSNLSF